jgi:hypothetical protein
MAIAYVQKASTSYNGVNSSPSVSWPSTPVEDNLLIAVCSDVRGDATMGMTSSGWTLAESQVALYDTGLYTGCQFNAWYKIAGSSEASSVQVNTANRGALTIYEFSGVDAAAPFERDNFVSDTPTSDETVTVGTGTTTNADAMAFTAGTNRELSQTATDDDIEDGSAVDYSDRNFVGPSNPGNRVTLGTGWKSLSSTGNYSAVHNFTNGNTSSIEYAWVGVFKAAGGGGGSFPHGPFSHPMHGPFGGPI